MPCSVTLSTCHGAEQVPSHERARAERKQTDRAFAARRVLACDAGVAEWLFAILCVSTGVAESLRDGQIHPGDESVRGITLAECRSRSQRKMKGGEARVKQSAASGLPMAKLELFFFVLPAPAKPATALPATKLRRATKVLSRRNRARREKHPGKNELA